MAVRRRRIGSKTTGSKRIPWQRLKPAPPNDRTPTPPDSHYPAPLTPKEARFVREYLVDCNATRAAAAAGYSKKNAKHIGHQLIERPRVAAAIAAHSKAVADKLDVTIERTVEELARLAYAPVGKKRGQIDPKNKISALVALGKYQRMFVERHEVTGGATFTLTVRKPGSTDL